jgi:predicted RNA-binding protein associated with RNAse of E/G family
VTDGRIVETKRTLDGRDQTFECGLVAISPRLVIVRFEHPDARMAGTFAIPAGSRTYGFFWPGRHYNLYRFTAPDGAVIAYRFDVVDSVKLVPGHIGYTDLLLDAWLAPGGIPAFEDEEDVAAADAAGLLSRPRRATIQRTRRLLESAHDRIVAEAEAELARRGT